MISLMTQYFVIEYAKDFLMVVVGILGTKSYKNKSGRTGGMNIIFPLFPIFLFSAALIFSERLFFFNNMLMDAAGLLIGIFWLLEIIIRIYKEKKSKVFVTKERIGIFSIIGVTFLMIFGFLSLLSFYFIYAFSTAWSAG